MAIQTIGGAAASTGVQGTPILKIQRATPSQAGLSFGDTEQLMEYTLTTPLPTGNYFFTFYSGSDNGGTQAILGLNDGTILASTSSNGSTSTVPTAVPAGKTLNKVWFRRNGSVNSWSNTIELNAIVSTDTANFYGYKKATADSRSFTVPPIPAGYTRVSNNSYLTPDKVSADGTKTYFVVMRSAAATLSTSGSATNFGAEHNTNMNSALKFYEYNISTGVLTEKAQPVFNSTLTCGLGWNIQSNPGGTTPYGSISHLQNSNCFVTPTYVYFDPGTAQGGAGNTGGNYTMDYAYGQMGRYNISTNTWTAVQSFRGNGGQGHNGYGAWTVAGDVLVLCPTFYYRNAYASPDTINLYQYNWYSQYASNYAYYYKPTTNGWNAMYNTRSTSSAQLARTYASSSPATDRYVFIDTDYQNYVSSGSVATLYILDVVAGTLIERRIRGFGSSFVSAPNGAELSCSAATFFTSAWFRHPTDSTKIYVAGESKYEFYLIDMGSPTTGFMSTSNSISTEINWYLTRTKWKVNSPSRDYYGYLYLPSNDSLILMTNTVNPNTSTTQTVKLGMEIVPFPDALAQY